MKTKTIKQSFSSALAPILFCMLHLQVTNAAERKVPDQEGLNVTRFTNDFLAQMRNPNVRNYSMSQNLVTTEDVGFEYEVTSEVLYSETDRRTGFSCNNLSYLTEPTVKVKDQTGNFIESKDILQFEELFKASFLYNGEGFGDFTLANKKSYKDFSFGLAFQLLDINREKIGDPFDACISHRSGPFDSTASIKGGKKESYSYKVNFREAVPAGELGKVVHLNAVLRVSSEQTSKEYTNHCKAFVIEHPIKALGITVGAIGAVSLSFFFLAKKK